MLSENLQNAFNNQINAEIYSAYLYYAIANYYEEKGLKGFASWFKLQAKEELEHADKFANYLHDQNVKVILKEIPKPKTEFVDFKEPLTIQLAHEKKVTSSIFNLYSISKEEKDYFAESFIKAFVDEQFEEEKTAQDLLTKYEIFCLNSKDIYEFSEKLGQRK